MGQNISFQCVKRRRAKTVDISNDIWLEAIKFLTGTQWSQKRYVCRQINAIIKDNISYLPKMVFACADMYFYRADRDQKFGKLRLNKHTVIASDTVMQAKQSTQWFEKRGFTSNAPANIPANDFLIPTKWNNVNICIHGSAQETIQYSDEEKRFFAETKLVPLRKPVLFYAQFNPVSNLYSWNYLAQFLKFIYHPMTYIKDVKMFVVNQTFIDSIKCNIGNIDNEPRYIRCESFSLKRFHIFNDDPEIKFINYENYKFVLSNENRAFRFLKMLKWLTQNVRTEILTILVQCDDIHFDLNHLFDSFTIFLLDPSGAKECASNKVKIKVTDSKKFLSVLIKKFRSSPLIEGALPTIEFLCRDANWEHLGANLIDQEVDSLGAYALYMISSGQNRMRISFCTSNVPIPWRLDYCDCKIRIYSI